MTFLDLDGMSFDILPTIMNLKPSRDLMKNYGPELVHHLQPSCRRTTSGAALSCLGFALWPWGEIRIAGDACSR